jgi:hypothetical protein
MRQRDPEQILQHCAQARDPQKPNHSCATLANQLQSRTQTDRRHERHHQQISQSHVPIDVHAPVSQHHCRHCVQHAAHNRRGNVQPVEQRQPPLEPRAGSYTQRRQPEHLHRADLECRSHEVELQYINSKGVSCQRCIRR